MSDDYHCNDDEDEEREKEEDDDDEEDDDKACFENHFNKDHSIIPSLF